VNLERCPFLPHQGETSVLTIHHVPGTRGLRIVWLCEELRIPYRIQRVDFSQRYRATPEWRALNPVGKVPVMVDGELKLFESGAMLQTLLRRHGNARLQPEPGSDAEAEYLQWCWFAEATFGRATGEIANHKRAFPVEPIREVVQEMRERSRLCLAAVEQHLQQRPYLVSEEFTAADIMMGYTLGSFTRHVGDAFPPATAGYWQRITSRPAYVAARAAEGRI
jgi:glutathione S-transferase